MNSKIIIIFFVILFSLSGCNSETATSGSTPDSDVQAANATDSAPPSSKSLPEPFKAESEVISNKKMIKAQLSAYSKSYMDISEIYVLTLMVGTQEQKVTSLKAIEITNKLNASKTVFTFTKPRNYFILYSYDAELKQGHQMRIPTDTLKSSQFADFPVLDKKTGKLVSTRIELKKLQHKG